MNLEHQSREPHPEVPDEDPRAAPAHAVHVRHVHISPNNLVHASAASSADSAASSASSSHPAADKDDGDDDAPSKPAFSPPTDAPVDSSSAHMNGMPSKT
eukprot:EC812540.1.p2 GENE.EC812540.1~~EC812540.1.p2  ORF type:complete len:100 (+),score=30.54 EC812540.1:67-366(+)